MWKRSNDTRSLADHIGVTPTIGVLKVLDTVTIDEPDQSNEPLLKRMRLDDDEPMPPLFSEDEDDAVSLGDEDDDLKYVMSHIKKHITNCSSKHNGNLNNCILFRNEIHYFMHFSNCVNCSNNENKPWILDSGASLHFTHEISDFSYYRPLTTGHFVQTAAKGKTLQILGVGTVIISHLINEKKELKIIRPVFYIPDMDTRLLSMGTFLSQGYMLSGNVHKIDLTKNNKMIQFSPHSEGQTIFWLDSTIQKESINAITKNPDYYIWHKCLGHPQDAAIKNGKNSLSGMPKSDIPNRKPICPGCAKGKMHSKPFPESNSRAVAPFDIIHSDLKEISMISYHKYKYFVTFIDDYSGYLWTVLLKKKSDITQAIKQFLALIKNRYSKIPKSWRYDGGSEFNSSKQILKDLGVEVQVTVPYQSQQNGRAECMNHTIWEKAQALCFDACLPPSWWEFSLEHVVYLYNRTPMAHLKWQMPYFYIHNEKPDISTLRVFGCQAYVYMPEEKRKTKLEPRSQMMIFLGFKSGTKGYKFMNPENNSIVIASTALFDEEKFPKCRKNPESPTFHMLSAAGSTRSDHDCVLVTGD